MNDNEMVMTEFYGVPLSADEQQLIAQRATELVTFHREHVRIGRRLFGKFTDQEALEALTSDDSDDNDAPPCSVLDALAAGRLTEDEGRALVARLEQTGRTFKQLHSTHLLVEMAARRLYRLRVEAVPTPPDGVFTRLTHWFRRVRRGRPTP